MICTKLIKLWRVVYTEPKRAFAGIRDEETALYGMKAYLVRGIVTSVIFYIPLVMLGLTPSIPSYIIFWPTEIYYSIMVIMFPIIGIAIWMITGTLTHIILSLLSENNDIVKILNINGLATLAVFPILLVFDWGTFIFFGGIDPYILGISHILIDFIFLYLLLIGYKQNLNVGYRLTFILYILQMIVAVSMAILFVRGI